MPTIADAVLFGGVPRDGASIAAYKASRFATAPQYGSPPPDSSPADATATSDPRWGGPGEWEVTVPTAEPYWVSATYSGQTSWQWYNPGGGGVTLETSASPAAVTATASPGTATKASASDHAHAGVHSVTAGSNITLTGTASDPVIAAAASGMSNPMTTQDDLIVGGASGAPGRLGKGTDGQVLTVDPATHHLLWATPAGGGGSSTLAGDTDVAIASPADGQVLTYVGSASKWENRAASGSGSLANEDQASVLINATSPGAAANVADHFNAASLDTVKWPGSGSFSQAVQKYSSLGLWNNTGSTVNFLTAYTPTGAFSVVARIRINGNSNNCSVGLILTDTQAANTGNAVMTYLSVYSNTGGANDTAYGYHLDAGTWVQATAQGWMLGRGTWVYLRLDGNIATGSFSPYISDDRNNWQFIGGFSKTLTPAYLGLYVSNGCYVSCDLLDVAA